MSTHTNLNIGLAEIQLAFWKFQPSIFPGAYYSFPLEDALLPRLRRQILPFYPAMTNAVVTLWPGHVIGQIIKAKVYHHNFGSRMVSITVQGTNGAIYYGRASWDTGNVITLRRKSST